MRVNNAAVWLAVALCVNASLVIRSSHAESSFGLIASASSLPAAAPADDSPRTAAWPFFERGRQSLSDLRECAATPHPAVARIIAPEHGATAFGTGTLVDVRDQYGLVVTNWHVVRDAAETVEVTFPGGFRSHARALKVDKDWDLAALVIWRPPIEPVALAAQPPRPGDLLTIHGYGRGQYRIATGRCTQYYAPHANYPLEMVEIDVEARQGDSGGPIFNQHGELAGVLFGAGQGTTLGSFGPRVGTFLATLAPDIGQARDQAGVAVAERPAPNVRTKPISEWGGSRGANPSSPWSPADSNKPSVVAVNSNAPRDYDGPASSHLYETAKSVLALIGIAAIAMRAVKIIR